MFSLRCLAKPSHCWLVEAIERPAACKNKACHVARSRFEIVFIQRLRCFAHAHKKVLPNNCLKADGTLTRLADSGTGAEDIGKAHCLGHFSERRFRATTRR